MVGPDTSGQASVGHGPSSLTDAQRGETKSDAVSLRPPGHHGAQGIRARLGAILSVVANVGTFFLIWQLVAQSDVLDSTFFPSPVEIFGSLVDGFRSGLLWTHLASSGKNFAIGLTLSCVIGVPVGLVMGARRFMDALLGPYVWALAAMPSVALVPLDILIFGFTDASKIVLIVLNAVFPIIINCMAGVKTVDPSLVAAGRVFGMKPRQLYVRIILPSASPLILSGINQGMTQALIGLVVAEMFATNMGLGYLLVRAQEAYDAPLLYAVMMLLIAVSLTFVGLMRLLERRLAPWQEHEGS